MDARRRSACSPTACSHGLTRRGFAAAGGLALAGACLAPCARVHAQAGEAGTLADPVGKGGLTSLIDRLLAEAERAAELRDLSGLDLSGVEWRFDCYAKDHAPELLDATLWAYEELVAQYRANGLASWAVDLADFFVETGDAEPDQGLYEEILLTVLELQDASRASDVRIQATFDDLKGVDDWVGEALDASGRALTVIVGTGEASAFQDVLGKVLGLAGVTYESGQDIAEAARTLQALARNYDSYAAFLSSVQAHANGPLANACAALRGHLASLMEAALGQADDIAWNLDVNLGEELFDSYLIDALKNSDAYAARPGFAAFIDKAGVVLDRVNLLQDAWQLGALAGKGVGQIVIGGEDLITRLREACALADISAALRDALARMQTEFYAAAHQGETEQAEALACDYVHLAQFLATVHLRGVYCERSIVAEDAGLWGLIHVSNAEMATSWYEECCARLDTQVARLGKIPLRGVGARHNGAPVVGDADAAYFVRYPSDGVETEGLFAFFAPVTDALCTIEMLDGAGVPQRPVCNARGVSELWLSYDRLFMKSAGELCSCELGEGILWSYGDTLTPQCIDDLTGTLVCTDYTEPGALVTFSRTGTRATLPIGEDYFEVLCADEGLVYYGVIAAADESAVVTVCACDLVLGETARLGVMNLPTPALTGVSIGAQVTREALYVAVVAVGGTGAFYGPGGIWAFDLRTQREATLVDPYDEGRCCNAPYFCQGRDPDLARALHFYAGESYSGAGGGLAPWVEGDLWRVDLDTFEVTPSGLDALTSPDGFAFVDGNLVVLDPAGENSYRLVASAQAFAEAGYPAIQDLSAANGAEDAAEMNVVARVDVVGERAYVTVHRTSRTPALDMGWRPCFARVSSAVYTAELDTDALAKVYEF